MKKRLMAFVLASTMLIGACLTGCGNEQEKESEVAKSSEKQSEVSQEQSVSSEEEVEELDPVTLNVWLVGVGKQKDSDKVWDYFNEQLQEYLPNTTVEFTAFTFDEYVTKWSTAMAAGETVDLAWFGWSQSQGKEVEMGTLTPLNDLLEEYCQDAVQQFGEDALYMHQYQDGNMYLFPCWQGLATALPALSFQADTVELMEDGWLENMEKLMKETSSSTDAEVKRALYEEMERYLETCKQNNMLRGGYGTNTLFMYIMQGYAHNRFGGSVQGALVPGDDTFTLHTMYDDELVKLNWEYLAKWYDAGYIRKDISSLTTVPTDFLAGDPENSVLTYAGGVMTPNGEETMCAKYDMDIKTIEDDTYRWLFPSVSTCWCIPYTTTDAERSAMLLNLLNSEKGKELYVTLTYGIEGEHYTMNDDGTATTLCGDGTPTSDWAYGQVNWVMGNTQNSLVTQVDDPRTTEYRKNLEVGAMINPIAVNGFYFDVKEIEALNSTVTAVYTEYYDMFNRGYLGSEGFAEEYAKYLEEMKAAGVDDYYAELQKQIDTFVKEKNLSWQ